MQTIFDDIWNFFSKPIGAALFAAVATQLLNFIAQKYFKNVDRKNSLELKNIEKRNILEIKLFDKRVSTYEKLGENLYNLQVETIVSVKVEKQFVKLNVFSMFRTYDSLKQAINLYRDHVVTNGAYLDRVNYNKNWFKIT